jgi:hypothetical protein
MQRPQYMPVITENPIIDALLAEWKGSLGSDYLAYRNHVYRVFNFACAFEHPKGEEKEILAIATAFHDIAIWLDHTYDYLEPSVQRSKHYLEATGHKEWSETVAQIIYQHHKISPWREMGLVESFRRADWLDVCLFYLPTRLDRGFMSEVLREFPRCGFHRRLIELTLWWGKTHPFKPLPMLRW